jgi:hypothetical protein
VPVAAPLLAHGGIPGLIVESLPVVLLLFGGIAVWRRSREERRASGTDRPGDEAGVEEHRREGEGDRGLGLAEPEEGAPGRGHADAGEDEGVPHGSAADGGEGHGDDGERAETVPDEGQDAGRPDVQMISGVGDGRARDG